MTAAGGDIRVAKVGRFSRTRAYRMVATYGIGRTPTENPTTPPEIADVEQRVTLGPGFPLNGRAVSAMIRSVTAVRGTPDMLSLFEDDRLLRSHDNPADMLNDRALSDYLTRPEVLRC